MSWLCRWTQEQHRQLHRLLAQHVQLLLTTFVAASSMLGREAHVGTTGGMIHALQVRAHTPPCLLCMWQDMPLFRSGHTYRKGTSCLWQFSSSPGSPSRYRQGNLAQPVGLCTGIAWFCTYVAVMQTDPWALKYQYQHCWIWRRGPGATSVCAGLGCSERGTLPPSC